MIHFCCHKFSVKEGGNNRRCKGMFLPGWHPSWDPQWDFLSWPLFLAMNISEWMLTPDLEITWTGWPQRQDGYGPLGIQAAIFLHLAFPFLCVCLLYFSSSFSRMISLLPQSTWWRIQTHPGVHHLIPIWSPGICNSRFSLFWNESGSFCCPSQLDLG